MVTVYVRPCRYTYGFMNDNDYFTVSFYPEEYQKALAVMGTKSGRDINKDEASGLTVKPIGQVVTYEEAEVTIICRKIYWQDLVRDNMPEDAVERFYTENPKDIFVDRYDLTGGFEVKLAAFKKNMSVDGERKIQVISYYGLSGVGKSTVLDKIKKDYLDKDNTINKKQLNKVMRWR